MADAFPSSHEDEDIQCELRPEVKVIGRNKSKLVTDLDPSILRVYLSDCLTKDDESRIEAKQCSQGQIRAADLFLHLIVTRHNFWPKLLRALREENVRQEHLADLLETDLENFKTENPKEVRAFEMQFKVENTQSRELCSSKLPTKRKLDSLEDTKNGPSISDELVQCKFARENASDVEERHNEDLYLEKRMDCVDINGNPTEFIDLTKNQREPRDYQKDLAKPALLGYNTIICAPTGSGKTMVASLICQSHLERSYPIISDHSNDLNDVQLALIPDPKILVVVPRFAILLHVYRELKAGLPTWKVGKRSGATTPSRRMALDEMFKQYQVIVVTADILKNAVLEGADKCMDITTPTLIIFDECHHTQKDSSYNKIMTEYLKVKYAKPGIRLPQIVGLSASPGAGKKIDDIEAREKIVSLCANLDARHFKTVSKEGQQELEKYVATPVKHKYIVGQRENDPFSIQIQQVMISIEHCMGIEFVSESRGSQEYESLIQTHNQAAIKARDHDLRKYAEHLMHYNQVLMFVNLTRMVDGYTLLREFYSILRARHEDNKIDETEMNLLQKYQNIEEELSRYSKLESDYPNPKLIQLKEHIINHSNSCDQKNEEMRGIIFVKTKLLTKALKEWMNNDEDLSKLSPEAFTGVHAAKDSCGTTAAEQTKMLSDFKEGLIKILISTSVGEEGIDIPACNICIRYNHVTNEIAMVQSRGRARQTESIELVIGDNTTNAKDNVNVLLEEKMTDAIKYVQENMHKLQPNIEEKQKEILLIRQREAQEIESRSNQNSATDVEIHCKGCKKEETYLCQASDIRLYGNGSHIIPDPKFAEKIIFKEHDDALSRKLGIKKIHCKRCDSALGNTAKNHPCLALKSISFVIDGDGSTYKKWNKVPCSFSKFV